MIAFPNTQAALSDAGFPQKVAPFKVGNFSNGQNRQEVNRNWSRRSPDQRFPSLSALHAAVAGREAIASEAVIESHKIEIFAPIPTTIEDTNILSVGLPDGTEVGPTHWAFNQLCGLGKAPAKYLRRKPSQIVADALTDDLRRNRGGAPIKSYVLGDELAAVTGADYGRIWDREVVEAVQMIAGDGTGDMRWKIPEIGRAHV